METDKDRDKFMNMIEMMRGNTEIVDNSSVYNILFGKD